MVTVQQDFEIKYNRLDFCYKSILNTDAFKNELLTEFEGLTPQMDFMLYVADKMDLNLLGTELEQSNLQSNTQSTNVVAANFVQIGKYESEFYRLKNEFFDNYSKTVDKKYFGRFLNDAPTIGLLSNIYNIFNDFESFVLDNANENYQAYATMVANKIIRLLNGKTYKNVLLSWFLKNDETPFMLLYLNQKSDSEITKLYNKLKGYFDEVVSLELPKVTPSTKTIERFALDTKKAVDIYTLCEKYQVFSKPPISEIDFLKCFDAGSVITIYPKFANNMAGHFHYILSLTEINQKQALAQFDIINYNDVKSKSKKARTILQSFKTAVQTILNPTIYKRC